MLEQLGRLGIGREPYLRYQSRLRHICICRAHIGKSIRLLVADAQVRIIDEGGRLLREMTIEPDRLYFGARTPIHNVLRQVSSMS